MKKKILVIEDEKELADLVKIRLQEHGYEVETAYDGEEGLAKIFSYEPDLIVLDLMLPKKGGLEVLKELRSSESSARSNPVIILSALKDMTTIMDAEKLGATDYMMKPYDSQALLELIKLHVA